MATDYFIYQVNKNWYRLYWAFMVCCNAALFGLYIIAQFSATFTQLALQFNVDSVMFWITGINLAYMLVFFWVVKRSSMPFAMLLSSMAFTLALMYGITNAPEQTSVLIFTSAWLISAFFTGIYGLPLLAGSVFITYVFAVLQYNFQVREFSKHTLILLLGELGVAMAAYLFWRGRFVSLQEKQVDELSGKLKTNQQQSATLIQSIADGIIVADTEGKITLMNPAAANMTEWPVNEAVGVDANLVAQFNKENGEPIEATENPFTLVLSKKEHINQTLQLTGRGKKVITVSLVISPVTQPGSGTVIGAVAVIRDISDARAAEKQRADFISTASHEMRTPVAAIEGYLALALNEKVSTIDSRARGYLEKAHTSTQHLGKLFQDLLTSSKAEDGRLSNHPSVVEMGAFLQQLTDDLKFAAEKKGLFVEFLVGSSNDAIDATNKDTVSTHVLKPLYYVYADPDRMREVITNLFDNACKYTDQGKISLGLTGDNDVVQMYIRDTGSGIPAEDVPHLFQKFYRVDNSATRTIGGTGLGLFICRKIVELYKGRIWVESELGKGSTFFINLPRLSTQRATALQASDEANLSTSVPTGTSVKS